MDTHVLHQAVREERQAQQTPVPSTSVPGRVLTEPGRMSCPTAHPMPYSTAKTDTELHLLHPSKGPNTSMAPWHPRSTHEPCFLAWPGWDVAVEWDHVDTRLCAPDILWASGSPAPQAPQNSWEPGGTRDFGTLHTSDTTHTRFQEPQTPSVPSPHIPCRSLQSLILCSIQLRLRFGCTKYLICYMHPRNILSCTPQSLSSLCMS